MAPETPESQTWILTGGIENFEIYAERNFDVIGMKEKRLRHACEAGQAVARA